VDFSVPPSVLDLADALIEKELCAGKPGADRLGKRPSFAILGSGVAAFVVWTKWRHPDLNVPD
jgi:hypothetical protein